MKEELHKARIADYLKNFHCIGGSCEDNCCIGWQVEIDEKTFGRYRRITEPGLKAIIKKHLYLNSEHWSPSLDYGLIELMPDKRCPFLNNENLCQVQLFKGESYLSNVCAGYPRIINRIEGILEYSAAVSCPEAAGLILGRKEGLTFEAGLVSTTKREIVNVDLVASDYLDRFLVKYFKELREFTMEILKNRKISLQERMRLLGIFYEGLEEIQQKDSWEEVHPFIENFLLSQKKSGKRNGEGRETTYSPEAHAFWMEISEKYNTPDNMDSERYLSMVSFSEESCRGGEAFPEKMDYILENYLVNYVFQNLFPATESQSAFDAFIKIGTRYALIRYGGMGMVSMKGELSQEELVRLIQAFSKATEHHFTFFDDILEEILKKKKSPKEILPLFDL